MKMLTWGLLLLLLLYLGALAWLYLSQRSILFHPTGETPARHGFFLDMNGERIRVEVRNEGCVKGLIYFPGNSEHYWEDPDILAAMLPEHTLYFPHYPGYGRSEGSPSQTAFFNLALRLYDTVAPRHRQVDVIGRSLGSGVAVYLAAHRPVGRLVLITPYDSITALGQRRYPIFPVRLIIKDPFESLRYAPEVKAPTLILLAEHDRVIPHRNSRHLIDNLRQSSVTVRILPGSDHTDILDHPDFAKVLEKFLEATDD